jgi:hypothetical protein
MPVVELLSDPSLRKVLNTDPSFERLRYLTVLAASTEPPFVTSGTIVQGKLTFNVKQLWRIANHLGLAFERFRGAERVFKQLEKSGLVSALCNEETGFHTQYFTTHLGHSQTLLNLDRLKKVEELQSQARTMQMTIKKQMAKMPPTVYEITLLNRTFNIGRDKDNDLSVDDRFMSSRHARIIYESGKWIFEDLNSRNGSYRIESDGLRRIVRAELSDNEMYQLGSIVIRFREPENN